MRPSLWCPPGPWGDAVSRPDALATDGRGDAVTTQEWTCRKVAARTSLTIEETREVLEAWYDLAWAALLQGVRLRLGDVGTLALCERRGSVATLVNANDGEEFVTRTRPSVELRGRVSGPFKDAWNDMAKVREDNVR